MGGDSKSISVNDSLFSFSEYLDERLSDEGVPSSGFESLDKIIGGFYGGKVYTVGARPAKGKTSFITNIALHNSKSVKVLIFSTEISHNEFIERLISLRSGVPVFDFRNNLQSIYEDLILRHIDSLEDMNIFINDNPRPKANEIVSEIDSVGPGLVIIDYLGQMFLDSDNSEPQAISNMMKGLKEVSRERNVPIVVASQLNRLAEMTLEGAKLSNLKGSGGIEEASDVVIFIENEDENGNVMFRVVKSRYGPQGEFKLKFNKENLRFVEVGGDW